MAVLLVVQPAWAQNNAAPDRKAKSRILAKNIDKHIYAKLDEAKVKAGGKASLPQLTRRLHIDLTGRIPTVVQLADLIDETNDSATKYEDRIDALLDDPSYATNFAHYWRSVILGDANIQQLAIFQQQFDGWLREKLSGNTSYDSMVREILASQARNINQQQNNTVSPAAFFNVNENKVENLAGATARVFMGVKIECAQCHAHPFASWSRKQFWEMAAFFNNSGQIKIPLTEQVAKARYLTGEEPNMEKNSSLRLTLAEWLTTPKNPYFAKATVDHVWQYFFGVSLVEPILEEQPESPPAHPELLDALAKGFADSGFDLKFLIRSIVLSEAYQRASVAFSEPSKVELQLFAKMPVRGMMAEQLFDSFLVATGTRQFEPAGGRPGNNPFAQQNTPRSQFLAMFNSLDRRIETQTSILQALYLMNGSFLRKQAEYPLDTIALQNTDTKRRVEALYMLTLSRMPSSIEMDRMTRFIENGGGSGNPRQAVVDVNWVLLNSSEFMLNH